MLPDVTAWIAEEAGVGEADEPDTFVSIDELCRRFGFSRQTFYRMLGDPEGGLDEVAVRVPPPHGRIRVPVRRFEVWLRARQAGRSRGN